MKRSISIKSLNGTNMLSQSNKTCCCTIHFDDTNYRWRWPEWSRLSIAIIINESLASLIGVWGRERGGGAEPPLAKTNDKNYASEIFIGQFIRKFMIRFKLTGRGWWTPEENKRNNNNNKSDETMKNRMLDIVHWNENERWLGVRLAPYDVAHKWKKTKNTQHTHS